MKTPCHMQLCHSSTVAFHQLILIFRLFLPGSMRFRILYWQNSSIVDNLHLILHILIQVFLLVRPINIKHEFAFTHMNILSKMQPQKNKRFMELMVLCGIADGHWKTRKRYASKSIGYWQKLAREG